MWNGKDSVAFNPLTTNDKKFLNFRKNAKNQFYRSTFNLEFFEFCWYLFSLQRYLYFHFFGFSNSVRLFNFFHFWMICKKAFLKRNPNLLKFFKNLKPIKSYRKNKLNIFDSAFYSAHFFWSKTKVYETKTLITLVLVKIFSFSFFPWKLRGKSF